MKPFFTLLLLAAPLLAADPEVTLSLDSRQVKPALSEDGKPLIPEGSKLPSELSIRLDKDNASLVWTDASMKKRTYQLDLLENHPGPRPWSDNLAWLVARSKDDFWILWAYVNESGTTCWINYYHFAENRIRMELFRGKYTYRPPTTFTNAPFEVDIPLERAPAWKGRKFKHKDFGPEGGKFEKLQIREGAKWKEREGALLVKPLIDLDVQANNGWDTQPWTEVHCLARSEDGTRLYYVVTYTAVDHGWVVDLKDGRVLKTHFGEAVKVEPKEPK
ncbi:MAG: hypothetical protein AAB074_01850 [Planctomycetota bacterium]